MTQTYKSPSSAARRSCCRALDKQLDPDLFKVLGDPTRLAMLVMLAGCGRPVTVSDIAACCPIDVSVVSRHLKAMRETGVLTAERRGKEVHYTVQYQRLSTQLRAIADAIDACCPPGCCT